MYGSEFRWRAIVLNYAYAVPCERVARIFGVAGRSDRRWYALYKETGHVNPGGRVKKSNYAPELLDYISGYVKDHPAFYVEELQVELRRPFQELQTGLSPSTILQFLRFELGLYRNVLERRAREAVPREIEAFVAKLRCWYRYPEQLLFLDETSKNGLDSMRRYAWSKKGTRAIVRVPFARGKWVSILAACDVRGFIAWKTTRGNFTRIKFHQQVIEVAMPAYVNSDTTGVKLFRHCGYAAAGLNDDVFRMDLDVM
ncbi:hypothetical protein BBJ28_00018773 [Nothophytophthora sp. Chile5]|nr:hypothetical protein BBJ28_00018773 [Nothophytophthora sp. Chile5]